MRVVAEEIGAQAQHERDVETIHPGHRLVAAGMDVAVPAPPRGEDEVSGLLAVEQANIRAALSWALGGQEREAGRELAARLARWWIATGRYGEAGQFLAMALAVEPPADPQVRARVLLGAAWSAYNLGDNQRATVLAEQGVACARQEQLAAWGRNLLAGVAWHAGDADRVRALLAGAADPAAGADPALAARAQVLLANAAFLAGDLAEQERHARRGVELARVAAGQEGLALALTISTMPAISGAGISPATRAALDEAAEVAAAQGDRFSEAITHHWRARLFATLGRLETAETEIRLGQAAGQRGGVRLVEVLDPRAEACLAVAAGQGEAAAAALRLVVDRGAAIATVMFTPAALAALARLAAIAGDESGAAAAVEQARRALRGRHEKITEASLTYAEGILAWRRGELADAEQVIRTAVRQWHGCGDRMAASDGIELLGVLAAARERFTDAARLLGAADAARGRLGYLAPGFTADRGAAGRAVGEVRGALGEEGFAAAREQGRGLTLDEAVAYAGRRGGGRKRPAAGWASLTPAELEVVGLASRGLRNEAIARQLLITPGTVKVHLSHIFTKLGVTTRAELAAQAAAQGVRGD